MDHVLFYIILLGILKFNIACPERSRRVNQLLSINSPYISVPTKLLKPMKALRLLILCLLLTPFLSLAQLIEGGREHSIILCSNGTVWTCGQNGNGQLGDGTLTDRTTPVSPAITNVMAVAAGDFHTLALRTDGTVWAWGQNTNGQLGDGTNTQQTSPVQVTGLTNIIKIDAGTFFSMALRNDGTVWTWGQGLFGQLGNSGNINSNVPVQVSGIINIGEIAAGASHGLAVSTTGIVYGWGQNSFGEVGDSSITSRNSPVLTNLIPNNIIQLEAGNNFSLALSDIGEIWAWGYNVAGQLGDNSFTDAREPKKIPGNLAFVSIAAGKWHSSAITVDSKYWTWGYNDKGQLADGGYGSRAAPYNVSAITNAAAVGGGAAHHLLMLADSTIWGVGEGEFGQIGNVAAGDSNTALLKMTLSCVPDPPCFTPVSNFAASDSVLQVSFTDLSAGGSSLLWDFGDGNTSSATNPTHTYIGGASYNVCLIVTNSCGADTLCDMITVSCIPAADFTFSRSQLDVDFTDASFGATTWAWNFGDAGTDNTQSPSHTYASAGSYTVTLIVTNGCGSDTVEYDLFVSLNILAGSIKYNVIAGGNNHSLVRCSDGSAWSMGSNIQKQLGDTNVVGSVNYPIPVLNLSNVASLESGGDFNLVLKDDGTVWTWGNNSFGQLGDGTSGFITSRSFALQVVGLNDIIEVSGGNWHAMALGADGIIYTWGYGSFGQMGDGLSQNRFTPGVVPNLSDIVNIRTGFSHSVALRSDGTVWTWGLNTKKQLGDAALGFKSEVPIQVTGLTNVVQIATGGDHSLARKEDGTVWAWGYNFFGQIGDSTSGFGSEAITPVKVDFLTNVIDISANLNHSMAVEDNGSVWTWGGNAQGQIGDSTTGFSNNRIQPVQVWNIGNIVAVSAAVSHSLALEDNGTVWGWGGNFSGQLGDSTIVARLVPVEMEMPCTSDLPCPAPVANFTYDIPTEQTNNLSAGATSFLWEAIYFGSSGPFQVDSFTTPNPAIIGIADAGLTVCLTAYNDCGQDSVCKRIFEVGLLDTKPGESAVHIYPNPFDQTTTFSVDGAPTWDLTIYDLLGKPVYTESGIRSSRYRLSGHKLPSGIYFYVVKADGVRIGAGKIVVQ